MHINTINETKYVHSTLNPSLKNISVPMKRNDDTMLAFIE